MKAAQEFKPEAEPDNSFEGLKKRVDELPSDQEQALEQLFATDLFKAVSQLPKAGQAVVLQRLKRRTSIALSDLRRFLREAEESYLGASPTELRDIVLGVWAVDGFRALYVAEWREWFIYEHGVYKRTLDETMLLRIGIVLERAGHELLESMLKDVLAKLARSADIYREYAPKPGRLLNVKNGLLDLETLELTEHTPEIVTFAQAPTDYNPEATAVKFYEFLQRVVPNETHRDTLQEFMGYVLTPEAKLQRALYLKGPGGTGKGTLLTAMQKLLSTETYGLSASMDIDSLNEDSFSLVRALNKRLVYISEVPARANLIGFKKITGGDSLLVNVKHKPSFNATFEAKIIITANTHIFTGDDSANNSIARRIIILPFEQIPGEADYNPYIADDISTPGELAGILLWCLEGWARLKANHFRFSSYGDDDQRREFLANSNPVITFLEERYTPEADAKIQAADLFEDWRAWCEGEEVNLAAGQYNGWSEKERWRKRGGSGHKTGSQKTFSEKASEAAKVLGWDVAKERTNTARYWVGLKRM